MQNGVFVFFLRTKTCFFSNNVKKRIKKTKKQVDWVFLNHDYLSNLFCDFPLIARSAASHVTISLIRCAPHT